MVHLPARGSVDGVHVVAHVERIRTALAVVLATADVDYWDTEKCSFPDTAGRITDQAPGVLEQQGIRLEFETA